MRARHEEILTALVAADRSGLEIGRIDSSDYGNIRVELSGDYGMSLTIEGPPLRVAAYLNRIHTFGSGPFNVEEKP